MDYNQFLESKQLRVESVGKKIDKNEINPKLFDFQKDIVHWAVHKGRCAVFADTGLGKALSNETPVLTPDGYKPMGEVQIDDLVIGSNGQPTKVIGVYPQGKRQGYKVTFTDGTSVICDSEHLWAVRTKVNKYRGEDFRPLTLQQIMDIGLKSNNGNRWHIPTLANPVEFSKGQELPIDPYLLGIVIGDGGISGRAITVSSADDEIIDYIKDCLPNDLFIERRFGKYDYAITHKIRGKKNILKIHLTDLGLMGKLSYEKFIPHMYKLASVQDRVYILQGLLDTDGSVSKGTVEFSTTSYQLALDVREIVNGLGGVASLRSRITSYTYNGEKKKGRVSYRMIIALPDGFKPFRLSRKSDLYQGREKYKPSRAIKSVEEYGICDMTCIKVDAPDSLFVIEHGIVTHNTFMFSEWARLNNSKVLVISPLSAAYQTVDMCKQIGIDMQYIKSSKEMDSRNIVITNYDNIDKINPDLFEGVILDESSILKNLTGATKLKLTEMFKETPYKLCATATPAPNDIIELANHAEFLNIMTRAEMLSTFFTYNKAGGTSKADSYRLKKHGVKEFYRWLASWAIALKKPSDLGYDDAGYILPTLHTHLHLTDADYTPPGMLPGMGAFVKISAIDAKKIRRQTIADRQGLITEMVNNGEKWVIWCDLNDESDALSEVIPDSINVHGTMDAEEKARLIYDFVHGDTRVLITKMSIAGMGINMQSCHNMIFFGINYSWEGYYQAVRRVWRFGQKSEVHVHVVTSKQEESIYQSILKKEKEAVKMTKQLIKASRIYSMEELKENYHREWKYSTAQQEGSNYTLLLGDSCLRMSELEDNSVDFIVYSPPFGDIFVYSATPMDIGNSTDEQFLQHYGIIVKECLRVLKPGRLCAVHIADARALKGIDGYTGRKDLSGDIIELHVQSGWHWKQRIVIEKNPQAQAIRLKDHGLLFKTLKKDSADLTGGYPDYVLIFRKPGENEVPIKPLENGEMDNNDWVDWASGVWRDISETDVLNVRVARSEDDERHMAPLQLGLIERLLKLWSNPKEVVFSPFAGIGSELYEAIRLGRYGVGIELKSEYYQTAIKNLENAEKLRGGKSLFDWAQEQQEIAGD